MSLFVAMLRLISAMNVVRRAIISLFVGPVVVGVVAAMIMGSPRVTRAAVIGVGMGVAAVLGSWLGSNGGGFDDGGGGGWEPIFL